MTPGSHWEAGRACRGPRERATADPAVLSFSNADLILSLGPAWTILVGRKNLKRHLKKELKAYARELEQNLEARTRELAEALLSCTRARL